MPDKSSHRKKKYSAQPKKKKAHSSHAVTVEQSPVGEVVSTTRVATPATATPSPAAQPAVVRHPYIAAELKTIGTLTGIMLVILIVLALVLN
ncbi:MAG: hypothetical protein Q8Q07_04810 [Dehalococcoidales bacterium]|nr:hypothetical protein [Dehalococcoidales bacterium]